jgi:N-acetylmuramoyl-L-alanine amidase
MQPTHFVRNAVILSLIFVLSLFAGDIKIQDRLSNADLGSIRSVEVGSFSYIPIAEFAKILSIPTEVNPYKKSINLKYKQNDIIFTAYSPFVSFNNTNIQMQADVRFPNREFYVPLTGFIAGLDASGINTLEYNAALNTLYVQTRPANIVRLSTYALDDTVKLVLHTARSFSNSDISILKDEEWLYINIDGGVVDIRNNFGFEQVSEVFEFIPLQITRERARLSLHLAPNISDARVTANEKTNEIVISLEKRAAASSIVLSDLQKEREKWKIDTIILDPGHGGRDPGAVGPGKTYEKNIVLNIAKATKAELERRLDVNVILTRDRDSFIALKGRTKKANEAGGKLFVSFHVDANPVKSLRGHTVYFLGPAKTDDARDVAQFENSVIKFEEEQNEYAGLSDMSFILAANAQNSYNKESQDFASIIDEEIKIQCSSRSHGVRQAGFYVLYGASMPNILIETGFMTNSSDRQKLASSSYQNDLAKAITDGIIKFREKYQSTNF